MRSDGCSRFQDLVAKNLRVAAPGKRGIKFNNSKRKLFCSLLEVSFHVRSLLWLFGFILHPSSFILLISSPACTAASSATRANRDPHRGPKDRGCAGCLLR